ncbi:MAG: Y-family DNA polymerase [Flavisolibacter sp.]
MAKLYATIWFPHLVTDWYAIRQPELREQPFVISYEDHGRYIIRSASERAAKKGILSGMTVADARAYIPMLAVIKEDATLAGKLLNKICEWCIRFTPAAAVDGDDGLILDASGCTHLWGGEAEYLAAIEKKLNAFGYRVRTALADTIGAAWALSRFGNSRIAPPGQQVSAMLSLPPAALRLDLAVLERLHKLGLTTIEKVVALPRTALRRRFGAQLPLRINQAFGIQEETIEPLVPLNPYVERLAFFDPVVTRAGIEKALYKLLELLCTRLQREGKGLRKAKFTGYRIDGKVQEVAIGTNRASCNIEHLFKLFDLKLSEIEPALGIELFTLQANQIEKAEVPQESFWKKTGNIADREVAEMLDRMETKIAGVQIRRYLPAEHYWPEHSYKKATSLEEKAETDWPKDKLRPVKILQKPEAIRVTAPVPDYPPMHFQYRGKLHKIIRADGPERIEPEWWCYENVLPRDYYRVEDEEGNRYWLFRSGHYNSEQKPLWFIHGFFP